MRLGAFFTAYALNSAGIVNDSTLHEAAGLDRRTARSYATLLCDLGVIAELPAWSTNRLKRLARGPKRYVADTGLWGAAVGADVDLAMSDRPPVGPLDRHVRHQPTARRGGYWTPAGPSSTTYATATAATRWTWSPTSERAD